jgi:hypothetical protein
MRSDISRDRSKTRALCAQARAHTRHRAPVFAPMPFFTLLRQGSKFQLNQDQLPGPPASLTVTAMYEQSPAQHSQPPQDAVGSRAGAFYPTIGSHSAGYRAPPSSSAAPGPSAETTALPNGGTSSAGGLKPVLRVKIAEPYRVHRPVSRVLQGSACTCLGVPRPCSVTQMLMPLRRFCTKLVWTPYQGLTSSSTSTWSGGCSQRTAAAAAAVTHAPQHLRAPPSRQASCPLVVVSMSLEGQNPSRSCQNSHGALSHVWQGSMDT